MQDHILEIKKFFPEAVCEKILLYFENYLEDAKVTNDDNPIQKNIRNCQTTHLLHRETTFGAKLLLQFIRKEIFKATKVYEDKFKYFSVNKINQIDLLKYDSNAFDVGYKFHVDQGTNASDRTVSVSICLNNKFEGGEFVFSVNGKEVVYPQNIGDLLLFPSNFMFPHQVNKVTKGTRYALISWLI